MPASQKSSIPTSIFKRKPWSAIALAAVLLLLAAALSLCLGSRPYSLRELLTAQRHSAVWRVLVYVRVPRTLAGLAAGAALATAGALLQTVLNNALAGPNVIGVNAGAGFLTILCAVLLPGHPQALPAAAFIGALAASALIYALAARAGLGRTTLVLAGVAVSSILSAGLNALTLLFPDVAVGASGFLLGELRGILLADVAFAAPYLCLGLGMAFLLAPDLNVLLLGEDIAASLGLAVGRTRALAVLAASLLAGAAVSFAGLLGFAGLLVPHIVRRATGSDCRVLLPCCALGGGAFVLLCDVLSRLIFAPFELPVGILMSLLGGPFFLWLLLRRNPGQRLKNYD